MKHLAMSEPPDKSRTADKLRAGSSSAFALWNLGFRPFFLLASIFSALSIVLWAAQFSGWLPAAYMRSGVWHAHEMLFGFTTAVIAGFLLTAVRNWTRMDTARGPGLMALVLLWILGRIAVATEWHVFSAVVNAAFPIAVAVSIGIPLQRSHNSRNYFFVGLLVLMAGLVLAVHLALPERLGLSAASGLQLALDLVLFIMAVMGGRVIPMFTNNGVAGADATRKALIEKLALGSITVLFAADALHLPDTYVAIVAVIGALSHGARLCLWKPWRTLATPLVWILHAAYAWIVIHLMLRHFAAMHWVSASSATHALTVGAIAGLTMGMMSRVSLGHTGRPLKVTRVETAAFFLVQAAALVRVFGEIALPVWYMLSIEVSAVLWAAAFGLFAIRYWPVLTRPRLDGKPA